MNCQGTERCITHDLWEQLSMQIENFLLSISLEDLVKQREQDIAPETIERPIVQMQV